jgi:6-phosphofructokinase 1
MKKNILYAQSGGVTPVINATACGVIETARNHRDKIGKVFAGKDGIIGVLKEELIDTTRENKTSVSALRHTPGGAFGSCRYKLKSIEESKREYERLIEVMQAHNIGCLLYNGGGDSSDTAHKVSQISKKMGFPVDVESMASSSTKVFVLEVMGRHAGWIAAASGLVSREEGDPPHIILFPEVPFKQREFLKKVKTSVEKYGYCSIVVSEGVRDSKGKFLADAGTRDAFGHAQLGGVAPVVANLVREKLGYKYHWAVSDYLQRSARHLASRVDVEQAYAVGEAAVKFAMAGKTGVMPVIKRTSNNPYRWKIEEAQLGRMANREKMMPKSYIASDGMGITPAAKRYLAPLIRGEDYPPYDRDGLPKYVKMKKVLAQKKLPDFKV